jgi:hypothetical protein
MRRSSSRSCILRAASAQPVRGLNCSNATPHLFMADRFSGIGVRKPPFDHSRKGQLPWNFIVGTVIWLVLKDFCDLFFRGRHSHLAVQGVDPQTIRLVRIAARPLIYKRQIASVFDVGEVVVLYVK